MQLRWESSARAELCEILDYIGDRNINAADRLSSTISRTLDFITANPFMYRAGRVADTREAVVHPNYVVIYCVEDEAITILSVLHTRQNYP